MEYKTGQEYKMKYIDKDQKEHEATYTPDKDTNIAGMINGFKDKTKGFFKLLSIDDKSLDESRKITEEKDSGLKDALDNDVELFDDIYLYLDEYIEDEDTKSEIEDIIDKYTGIGGSAEDLDEDSEEYKSELEDCINEIEDLLNLNESKKITESEDNKVTDPNHDVKEYVYDNEDIDDLDIDTIKEDIEDYLGEEVVSDKLAQEILNTMNNIKNTVKYYTPYNGEKLIELNANHTIWDLDVPDTLTDEQFSEATDEYWDQARTAMEDLEIELGQDVYGEGRMGRHICVKNTYDNAINYEKLVSKQKEAEKNLINNINDYMKGLVSDNKTESKKITESEDKPELADMLIEINRYYIDYIDNISFFIDLANVAGIDYDKVYDWYKSIKEDENDDLEESKKITESEDKYTYDKDEEEKLRKIFKDLQDGYSYGYDMKNVSYPIFKKVLSIGKSFGQKDYGTNYINVNYYGGTSHKITLDNLKWIMNKIFNMTPSKFLSKFIRNDKSTIKD